MSKALCLTRANPANSRFMFEFPKFLQKFYRVSNIIGKHLHEVDILTPFNVRGFVRHPTELQYSHSLIIFHSVPWAGGSVGGLLLIGGAAGLAVYLCRRKRQATPVQVAPTQPIATSPVVAWESQPPTNMLPGEVTQGYPVKQPPAL